MREIKFRAWNKVNNIMHPFINTTGTWSFSFLNPNVFIWLQYTGLKDKNKIEMYEGDIISVNWDDFRYKTTNHLIEWNDMYASFQFPGGCPHNDSIHFEVIGNKYENPELLKSIT